MSEPYESYWYAEIDADAVGVADRVESKTAARELERLPRSSHARPRVLVVFPDVATKDGVPDAKRSPRAAALYAAGRLRIWAVQYERCRGASQAAQWRTAFPRGAVVEPAGPAPKVVGRG